MNFFEISPNDQSIYYLGRIFGYVGGVLPVKDAPLLLGNMFKTFNTVALTLGILVIVYTSVVGLMATAHEGEFMGKKWSGLWVPLRSLMGIIALFPTSTGYSALQVFMMWFILQGVSAADTVWKSVLSFTQVAGSPFATVNVPNIGSAEELRRLYQGITCQANTKLKKQVGSETTSSSSDESSDTGPSYYCDGDPNNRMCRYSRAEMLDINGQQSAIVGNRRIYGMGPSSKVKNAVNAPCGTLEFCFEKDCDKTDSIVNNPAPGMPDEKQNAKLKCAVCAAQNKALQAIVNQFDLIAKYYVEHDQQYYAFFNSGKPAETPPWIVSYCAARQVPAGSCCVKKGKSNNPATANFLEGATPEAVSPCMTTDFFKDLPYDTSKTPTDVSNASSAAVKNVYWPYVIGPAVNSGNFIDVAVNYYTSALINAVNKFIQETTPAQLSGWTKEAYDVGWIMAGAYYYNMAKQTSNNIDAAMPTFSVPLVSGLGEIPDKDNQVSNYRNNYLAAATLVSLATEKKDSKPNSIFNTAPQAQRIGDILNAAAAGLMRNWMDSMTGMKGNDPTKTNVNPLAELQSFGKNLLITAEVLYAVTMAVIFITSYVSGISFFVLGTGAINPGGWSGLAMLFLFLLPVFMGFLGTLFVFGGMLAVYVPLIPYTVFALGALGWLISTIEAMVAAPLIGLGMLSPGGQHEIFGRAEPALLMGLNVLLRPSLMIFGLMAAMLLASVGLLLVNSTFQAVMGQVAGTTPGMTEMILFMAAYTMLVIAMLNKCFSLIHLIPERVLTWIGGHAASYGEGEMLGEVKRGTEGAGATTGAAAKGSVGESQKASADFQKGKKNPASTGVKAGEADTANTSSRPAGGSGPPGGPSTS